MRFRTARRLAALSLVAFFAATHSQHVDAIDCDGTNSTDFRIDTFTVEYDGLTPSFSLATFDISNIGPTPNFDAIWFNVYELDGDNNRVEHIGRVFSNNFVTPGSQLTRAFIIPTPLLMLGTTYEGEVEYACETDMSNNTATFLLVMPDELFESGFEQAPSSPGHVTWYSDGGYEILGYTESTDEPETAHIPGTE